MSWKKVGCELAVDGFGRVCWCITYPRHEHVEYDTHRPHVALVVILAMQDLRSHVVGRAHLGVGFTRLDTGNGRVSGGVRDDLAC